MIATIQIRRTILVSIVIANLVTLALVLCIKNANMTNLAVVMINTRTTRRRRTLWIAFLCSFIIVNIVYISSSIIITMSARLAPSQFDWVTILPGATSTPPRSPTASRTAGGPADVGKTGG
jgi:hypothetical protein